MAEEELDELEKQDDVQAEVQNVEELEDSYPDNFDEEYDSAINDSM